MSKKEEKIWKKKNSQMCHELKKMFTFRRLKGKRKPTVSAKFIGLCKNSAYKRKEKLGEIS